MELKATKLEEYASHTSKTNVLVGGCFDILHIGHIRFLKEAKKLGDILTIALENDDFIREQKKREPFHTIEERVEMLSSLRFVDEIIILPRLRTFNDYCDMVNKVKPTIIAVSSNDKKLVQKKKQAKMIGAKIFTINIYVKGKSTTEILTRKF